MINKPNYLRRNVLIKSRSVHINLRTQQSRVYWSLFAFTPNNDSVEEWYKMKPYANQHGKFKYKAQELEAYAIGIVRKDYFSHVAFFRSCVITLEDLVAEARMIVFELIRKNPSKTMDDFKGLVSQAVSWKLKNLKRDNYRRRQHEIHVEVFYDADCLRSLKEKDSEQGAYERLDAILEMVSTILSEEEHAVLSMKFIDGMTGQEIADVLGCHKSQVTRMLKKCFAKIRKEFPDLKGGLGI